MACIKLASILLLCLLSGMVLFGELPNSAEAKVCPQFCLDVAYMTCKSTGSKKLRGVCNCCMAPKGCTLHLKGGAHQTCP